MRQGSLPAVMAAPITSSEDLPAGISCAATFSFGCAEFQAATICLPQATSWALFEYQILIAPCELVFPEEPPLSPHAAVVPRTSVADTAIQRADLVAGLAADLISAPCDSSPGTDVALGRSCAGAGVVRSIRGSRGAAVRA